ncbi:hypothetical protein L9G15_15110 [Shewanella sp. A3A]|nr:hypothetical protein [Shewanella ferrihydritica]
MKLRSLCGVVLLLALSGCSSFFSHQAQSDTSSSSLLSFLYPNHERPTVTTELPLIKLPATVGIAFVPPSSGRDQGISVAEQMQLLSQVKKQFESYDYIGKIEITPREGANKSSRRSGFVSHSSSRQLTAGMLEHGKVG